MPCCGCAAASTTARCPDAARAPLRAQSASPRGLRNLVITSRPPLEALRRGFKEWRALMRAFSVQRRRPSLCASTGAALPGAWQTLGAVARGLLRLFAGTATEPRHMDRQCSANPLGGPPHAGIIPASPGQVETGRLAKSFVEAPRLLKPSVEPFGSTDHRQRLCLRCILLEQLEG